MSCVHLNANGLVTKRVNKLNSQLVQNFFDENDLILFSETWSSPASNLDVIHFEHFALHRLEKKEGCKRDSGGLVAYVSDRVSEGIDLYLKDSDDIIILKLCKDFFSFNYDVYLVYCYIIPDNSSRQSMLQVDTFDRIQTHIAKISQSCGGRVTLFFVVT